ncbi:uncharacterized protein BYT42DRAFT_581218 [Radiomyces spectabilis]|uniref:uncharacterized protein n=1 Tax=Radiomyces spectabilis TaxID=64574 RepID=UPI002220C941|nr:uncharacterized protein BYT42DRAFT_581218 [Radiomyces spectabilis]KAI8371701.1 hypothetical protein BYT42DRAFT_581218 [Radiomyces spectabilis]
MEQAVLSWWHVLEASTFVFIAAAISMMLGMRIELSLIISGLRCVVQLSLMGYVLDDVLQADNVGVVMLMTLVLVVLGTYEMVFNRTKKTFKGMFPLMFVILFISNCFVGYLGSAFALMEKPFWTPVKFIPIIGMLLGNSMSSIAMATETCLDHVSTHAPLLETRLAYGATRYEATLPLAVDSIRMSLLPIITQLSVMGMINIPGMMTGQLMAGTPMMQAVIYQQVIMFMVAASSVFGVVMAVVACMMILVDKQQILRDDRILDNKPIIRSASVVKLASKIQHLSCYSCFSRRRHHDSSHGNYEVVEMK